MRYDFFFILLCVAAITTACTMTGTGRKQPAPVVGFTHEEDTAAMPGGRPQEDTYTVAMVGDIMMGTTYPDNALPKDDGAALFIDVKDILSRADIAAGNLEGTLCDTAEVTNKKESDYSYSFRTPIEFAPRLKEAGFDFLCMANNHACDFGYEGVRSTERTLDKLGIAYAGLTGRRELAVVERRGIRFGLCAFGHNSRTLKHRERSKVKEILDSLQKVADIVIVSFHGGGEGKAYSHLPYGKEEYLGEDRGELRNFARFCIDNGADIVFGHGPHVVRCVELYKDRLIAYSLGNFCTPYGISILGTSGYAPVIVAETDRQGRFMGGRIYPFIQKRGLGPRRDTTYAAVNEIRRLTADDVPGGRLTIHDDGTMTERR